MKRGEIWLINLNPTIGAEIKKTRPALIINDDNFGKLPLRIIIPITDWKPRFDLTPWMVTIIPNSKNNLSKKSVLDCFQLRSLSTQRFYKKIGTIDNTFLKDIELALSKVLKIAVHP